MISRLAAATVALVLTVAVATGCSSPAPAPEPSPTFTSEDQAFAAAEATYRAYVDALNQVDLSDPSTFEGVYAWTTGDFYAGERKTLSRMHANGWTVSGQTIVERIDRLASGDLRRTVTLGACANVATVVLVDSNGTSRVDASRPDVQSTKVSLVKGASPTGYLVSDVVGYELDPLC